MRMEASDTTEVVEIFQINLASNISNILRRMLGWIGGIKNELASSSDRLQQLHLATARTMRSCLVSMRRI